MTQLNQDTKPDTEAEIKPYGWSTNFWHYDEDYGRDLGLPDSPEEQVGWDKCLFKLKQLSAAPKNQDTQIKKCHDCGVNMGELHKSGCDWEECPFCHHQLIGCNCCYKLLGIDSQQEPVYSQGLNHEQSEAWEKKLTEKGLIPFGRETRFAPKNQDTKSKWWISLEDFIRQVEADAEERGIEKGLAMANIYKVTPKGYVDCSPFIATAEQRVIEKLREKMPKAKNIYPITNNDNSAQIWNDGNARGYNQYLHEVNEVFNQLL